LKSRDGGKSWKVMNEGLLSTNIRKVVVDPVNPSVVYAGSLEGVYKSIDGGSTWRPMNRGLVNASENR
jgi:photosystem II stability/assembly factor-like uncharacterized protein